MGAGDLDLAWWVDKNGEEQYYWTGSNSGTHICECGVTNSCFHEEQMCNCDSSVPSWFSDDGTLTGMSSLPVHSLHFGGLQFDSPASEFQFGSFKMRGH
jgi:hypothetical protein